jgi:hypothetical protein
MILLALVLSGCAVKELNEVGNPGSGSNPDEIACQVYPDHPNCKSKSNSVTGNVVGPANPEPTVPPTAEPTPEPTEEGALRMFQAVPIAAPIVQSYFDQGFYLVDIAAWGECTIDGVTFYGVNEQGYACAWTFNVSKPPPEGVFLGTTMHIEVSVQGVNVEEMQGGYLVFHGYVDYLPGSDVMDSDRASQTARSLCPILDTGDQAVRLSLFPPAEGSGWRWDGNAYQKSSVMFDAITGAGGGC